MTSWWCLVAVAACMLAPAQGWVTAGGGVAAVEVDTVANEWPYCGGQPSYAYAESAALVSEPALATREVIVGTDTPDVVDIPAYGWYNPVGWWNGYFYDNGPYSRGYSANYRHNNKALVVV